MTIPLAGSTSPGWQHQLRHMNYAMGPPPSKDKNPRRLDRTRPHVVAKLRLEEFVFVAPARARSSLPPPTPTRPRKGGGSSSIAASAPAPLTGAGRGGGGPQGSIVTGTKDPQRPSSRGAAEQGSNAIDIVGGL